MLYRSQSESVKPVEIDYSYGKNSNRKCTYTRDQKPEKDPFDCKSLKGEWL